MKNRVKELRARYDLTQAELAKKVGVRRETIVFLEKGKYSPSLKLAAKIAKTLKSTVDKAFVLGILVVAFLGLMVRPAWAATVYVNSSSGNDTTGDGASGTPYKTFHKGYTEASAGDTLDLTGTFSWTDAAETGDASTNGYVIAKNLTIVGQGADSTIIQAHSSDNSADRRVLTINSGVTATIESVNIRYGKTSSDGGGLLIKGTVTMDKVRIFSNRSTSGSGGGAQVEDGTLTIQNSTVDNNVTRSQGGGLHTDYYTNGTGTMHIINCTIAYNSMTYTVATVGGGGVAFRGSGGTITNSTIAHNNMANGTADGAGIFYYPRLATTLTIKNSIIADNTNGGSALSSYDDDIEKNSGTITDNGYNILGNHHTGTFTPASTTWTDGAGTLDGTFTKSGGGSGSLGLSDTLADNNSLNKTLSLTIAETSVAADNGDDSDNGAISIPSTDQRGLNRDASIDIGAYEYGATNDQTPPDLSGISVTPSDNGVTIDWTSDEDASSIIDYGLTNSFGSSTDEANTDTRVTSHSESVASLIPCTTYHYQVRSNDGSSNEGTGTAGTFTTTGCTGSASVLEKISSDLFGTGDGGTAQLTTSGSEQVDLTIPSGYSGTAAYFQIKQLDKDSVIDSTSTPGGYSTIGDSIYDFSALSDTGTAMTSFLDDITVTLTYDADDVVGLSEGSLWIYRWDGSSWQELTSCLVDTTAKTVTCLTSDFSTFGLFGTPQTGGGGGSGGDSDASCGAWYKIGIPDLFRIDRWGSGAKLYFSPVVGNDRYWISYSESPWAEEYGAEIKLGTEGVQSYLVNYLKPGRVYYFKVRSGSGCESGQWSKIVKAVVGINGEVKVVEEKDEQIGERVIIKEQLVEKAVSEESEAVDRLPLRLRIQEWLVRVFKGIGKVFYNWVY